MLLVDIPLASIVIQHDPFGLPINPRGAVLDSTDLQTSIKAQGLLQPLVVRPAYEATQSLYLLVHGHRRYTAVSALGWERVPCTVLGGQRTQEDDILLMLAGDTGVPYPPLSVARAFVRLRESGKKLKEIASAWGKTADVVSAHIELLDAAPVARQAVMEGRMGISVFARIKHLPQAEQEVVVSAVPDGKPITMGVVMEAMKGRRARSEERGAKGEERGERDVVGELKAAYRQVIVGLGRVGILSRELGEWPIDVALLQEEMERLLMEIRPNHVREAISC